MSLRKHRCVSAPIVLAALLSVLGCSEEANDNEILGMLKMAGASAGTLLMIDKQLGKREFKG